MHARADRRHARVLEQLDKRRAADIQRARDIFSAFRTNLRESLDPQRSKKPKQKRCWGRRAAEAVAPRHRLDAASSRRTRRRGGPRDRGYRRPLRRRQTHTTAAAVVFRPHPEDAKEGCADGAPDTPATFNTSVPQNCTARGLISSTPTARSLAIAPLKRVWPQGMPALDNTRKKHCYTPARTSKPHGRRQTEPPATPARPMTRTASPATNGSKPSCAMSSAGPNLLSWGPVAGVTAQSPNRAVTVGAEAALLGPTAVSAPWCR